MSGLLSAVSGQFTKYLLLGTFLPVVIFVGLLLVCAQPIVPPSLPLVKTLTALDKQWFTIAISAVTVVASGLLYNLNIPIIRIYEGYPWKNSRIGQWRVRSIQEHFDSLTKSRSRLRKAWQVLEKNGAEQQILAEVQAWQDRAAQSLQLNFPDRDLILPTKLGNTIRSFEVYSWHQYGADAIAFWPRLIAVTPKDYLTGLDDAKTSLDFFLNASLLSSTSAALLLALGLAYKRPFAEDALLFAWVFEIVGLVLASWLFYRSSIGRAIAWGALVKSTFDLYRLDLLKQLGYAQKPGTRAEECDLWNKIYLQLYYGNPPKGAPPPPDYLDAPKPTVSLTTAPKGIRTQLTYGRRKRLFGNNMVFTCRVVNLGDKKANDSTLFLNPETGWEVVWGSALLRRTGVTTVPHVSANLQFELGSLQPQEEVVFTCRLMPLLSQKNTTIGGAS